MKGNDIPIVAIRADGNESLGMGHLMRCMTIATACKMQGAMCVFFVAQEQAGVFVRERGFACKVLDTDYQDMEAELPRLREKLEECLTEKKQRLLWLVDSYQLTQIYLRELQKTGPVFYMDDTGEQVYEADGLINYNIYGDELEYIADETINMQLLLGVKYAPVREAFVRTPYCVREDVQNVLITMGGSDKLNITEALCRCLQEKLPKGINLTLICGRFNPHLNKLLQLQEAEEGIRILVDVPDVWKEFALADVAVAAAGSTLYELSAMGVPTVCCYYVENQRQVAEGFASKVGMYNAGDYAEEPEEVLKKMAEEVCKLVGDRKARKGLSERMKQVVTGQGASQIAKELLYKNLTFV